MKVYNCNMAVIKDHFSLVICLLSAFASCIKLLLIVTTASDLDKEVFNWRFCQINSGNNSLYIYASIVLACA